MTRKKKVKPQFERGEKVWYDDCEWTVVLPNCSYDGFDNCVGLIREVNGEPYTVTTFANAVSKRAKITIHTAQRYSDLPNEEDLLENFRSPIEQKEYIDALLVEGEENPIDIYTLTDVVVNILGSYIEAGAVSKEDVEVVIYANKEVFFKTHYDEAGLLTDEKFLTANLWSWL